MAWVRVQFDTAVKYLGTRHTAHTPFDAREEDITELVSKGATVLMPVAPVKEEEPPVDPNKEDEDPANQNPGGEGQTTPEEPEIPTKTELLNMKSARIKEYAESLGVDLTGCTNNEQRAAAILAHFSKK